MFISLTAWLNKLNTLYLCSLLVLITSLCYLNTLNNGLFFDDEQFIYNNQAVKTFSLAGFFGQSLVSEGGKISNYYRPILFLGYGMEYSLFGPVGFIYHLDSFLLHAAGGVVLFLLLKKLFAKKTLAFTTSLLFLIHPIQTEAVAYASGRGDPLSFFFSLLTLYFSLTKEKKHQILAWTFLVLALLSKEVTLMLPGLIFLVQLFSKKSLTKHTIYQSLKTTLPFAVITLIYFILRLTVLNFANTLNFYQATNIYSSSLFVRLNTFFHLFPSYLQLLIFPKTLFMERDSGIVIQTLPTVLSVISFVGCLGAVGAAILLRKKYPILLFAIQWVVISFIPTSGILPINGIFYEHFLYYPSVGFFLLAVYGFFLLYEHSSATIRLVLGVSLCAVILILSIRTIIRNNDWHDPITFYRQLLSHVQSPRAYTNLAMTYADRGDNTDAITAYQRAIALSDTYPETHYDLGNSYAAMSQVKQAESEYKKALAIDPSFYLSYIKLYSLYKQTNDLPGLSWIEHELTNLGQKNSQYLQLLQQLKSH
ncbi:MAG TPA: tetratricopeptide repeat protein [Patescibacteria group bacterium]|nr:tetratricopeptide repeat protein [Patescibacteria group bacterium]